MGRPHDSRPSLSTSSLGVVLAVYVPFLAPLVASHVAQCGTCRTNWLASYPGLPGLLPITLVSAWLERPLPSGDGSFLILPTVVALGIVLALTFVARRSTRAHKLTLGLTALLALANAFALASAFAA